MLDFGGLSAFDTHVHLGTKDWIVDSMGPYQASVERYFNTRMEPVELEEMVALYRRLKLGGLLLAWDAERHTGRPALSNTAVAHICRQYPDVFIGFGSVDPHRADARARLEEVRDLGLLGLKLHPTLQNFAPDDPDLAPFFEAAASLGLRLLVHTGTSGVGAGEPGGQGLALDLCRPMRLDALAARYPEMPILLAHVGWPWHLEALAMALHKTNVFIDISGWKPKYLPPEVLRDMRGRLRRQFCFGTDYPMFDPEAQLQATLELDLPEPVLPLLLKENARRFLGLSAESH
jgi:predicted TIM-barrel fold metal-dependent hydrolase